MFEFDEKRRLKKYVEIDRNGRFDREGRERVRWVENKIWKKGGGKMTIDYQSAAEEGFRPRNPDYDARRYEKLAEQYRDLVVMLDRGTEPMSNLDTSEGKEAFQRAMSELHEEVLDILEVKGVEVKRLQPQEEVSIEPSPYSTALATVDLDGLRALSISETLAQRENIWRQAGVAGEGETIVIQDSTIMVEHSQKLGLDIETSVHRIPVTDFTRGQARVRPSALRSLSEIVLRHPQDYRVVSGRVELTSPATVKVGTATETYNNLSGSGGIFIVRKATTPSPSGEAAATAPAGVGGGTE